MPGRRCSWEKPQDSKFRDFLSLTFQELPVNSLGSRSSRTVYDSRQPLLIRRQQLAISPRVANA